MLPDAVPVPASLMTLLAVFSPLFTAPTFRTFTALACGFLAQSGKRTVCGMLTGAGLSRDWSHDRAHSFFARARWNPDDLGIFVAKLVIALLVPDGGPVEVLIDDTLFKRRGKLIQAEEQHRDHAVVEQVFADVTSGPLAHLPSGVFTANAAWLAIAAMAHNLVRAAGALASLPFAKARAATIRRDLIAVAARTARHGRGHLTLHLPEGWHREHEWLNLLHAACGPPAAAA